MELILIGLFEIWECLVLSDKNKVQEFPGLVSMIDISTINHSSRTEVILCNCFSHCLLHALSLYLVVENIHKFFVALSSFASFNLWTLFTNPLYKYKITLRVAWFENGVGYLSGRAEYVLTSLSARS
jgi:hypothetical protein